MPSIYVDHAATTPLSPAAFKAITSQLQELGNPSSLHTHGRATRKSLEDAREAIAREVGSLASEVIFTASGTEANNIALKGLWWNGKAQGKKVVVISAIEHSRPARRTRQEDTSFESCQDKAGNCGLDPRR